jgi:hypothetical protein
MNSENGTVTPSSGWYDEGATVQITATDPTATSGEQYSWLEWTGTGTGSYSGTGKSAIVTMNGPITETATWEYEVIRSSTSIHITLSSQKITEGETINVSGYITPAHEATITLTYRRADGLSSNNTVTSSSDGTFTQRYTPPEKGSWSVTASWLGDNNYYGSTSSTEQFTVEGFDWDKLQVILAVVGIAVSIILVGAAYYNSCRKRGKLKNLLDEIDEAFFRFKRNSRRCEAELYRLKDIVLEQYKSGIINEGSYVILNERIDDYISKLSQP